MKLVSRCLLCLLCFPLCLHALALDDFAPNFVNASNQAESLTNNQLTVVFSLPESGNKQDIIKVPETALSCDKDNNLSCASNSSSNAATAQAVKSTTVLSQQPVSIANQGSNDQYFNRNGNSFDQNAINNFNITNSNQTTMQAYSAQLNNATLEDKLKQNIAIPLSTGSNSAVSVGTNNVQFNVSY